MVQGYPEKKVVEVQVDGAPVSVMRNNPVPLINLNRYHQAELITLFYLG